VEITWALSVRDCCKEFDEQPPLFPWCDSIYEPVPAPLSGQGPQPRMHNNEGDTVAIFPNITKKHARGCMDAWTRSLTKLRRLDGKSGKAGGLPWNKSAVAFLVEGLNPAFPKTKILGPPTHFDRNN